MPAHVFDFECSNKTGEGIGDVGWFGIAQFLLANPDILSVDRRGDYSEEGRAKVGFTVESDSLDEEAIWNMIVQASGMDLERAVKS